MQKSHLKLGIRESLVYEINKVYVIGDRGVGKSTLVKRFNGKIKGKFPFLGFKLEEAQEESKSPKKETNGIVSSKFQFGNYTITFKDLSDTPDWKYTKRVAEEIEEIKAVIAVFSLVSRSSFEYVKLLIDFFMKENISNYLQIILIWNKSDLLNSIDNSEVISQEEITKYLESIPCCFYFAVSCKDETNINQVIKCLSNLELDKLVEDKDSGKKKESKGGRSCLIF